MENEMLLVDRWLEWKAHNQGRSESTVVSYRRNVVVLKHYLADHGLTLLTADANSLEDFSGRHLHEMKVRPQSRRLYVTAIRGFYSWLKQKGVVDDDPSASLPLPNTGRPLPKPMQLAAAEKLLMQPGMNTFLDVRDTAILAVMIGSGCRLSGVVNLHDQDLIWTQSKSGTERLVIRLTEKGKKERLVPVPLETSLLVRAYLGHPSLDEIERTLPDGRNVLFVTTNSRHVPPHQYFGEERRMSQWAVLHSLSDMAQRQAFPKSIAMLTRYAICTARSWLRMT